MTCSRCQKNEAVIFSKEIINNKISEYQLCLECAQAAIPQASLASPIFDLLSSLGHPPQLETPPSLKCPQCLLQFTEFQKTGFLGCALCYQTFAKPLEGVLKQIHGKTRHVGKTLAGAMGLIVSQELAQMRKKLESAIREERFEDAVELRDQIRKLEGDEKKK